MPNDDPDTTHIKPHDHDDYSQYREPMAIFLVELWEKERERTAEIANQKLEARLQQVNQIRANGRRSLSGSLAEALGMVPPLGKTLERGDRRKRIQAIPSMEPARAPRTHQERPERARRSLGKGSKPGPVLVVVGATGKRGRGRPKGSRNRPKLPEGA